MHVCVCDEGGGGIGGVRVMEVVECMHGGDGVCVMKVVVELVVCV